MEILNSINYIDVSLVLIFLVFTIIGYKRGLLITIVNVFRYIIGFALSLFCSSASSPVIYESFLKQRTLDYLDSKVSSGMNVDDTIASLPSFVQQAIGDAGIIIPNKSAISQTILDNYLEPIIISALKIIVFLAVFILFFAITGIVIRQITRKSKRNDRKRRENKRPRSFIKVINSILGALFGIVKSAVLVLAIASVLIYIKDLIDVNSQFFQMLNDSRVLNMVNEFDLFNLLTEVQI